MIAEIQTKMFRPHAVTMGMRQQVVSRKSSVLSKDMAKVVALIICISLFVVFAFSQVMNWQIEATASQLKELQSVHTDVSGKNIELLATRAKLSSLKYVQEQAGEKLDLLVPQNNQIYRL